MLGGTFQGAEQEGRNLNGAQLLLLTRGDRDWSLWKLKPLALAGLNAESKK